MGNEIEKCLVSDFKGKTKKQDQTEFFFKDSLSVKQPEKGYRFSMDAAVLAGQADPGRHRRIVDLGTGCGIIALILARRFPDTRIFAVEIQPSMARLANFNVSENKMENQIRIICADMRVMCPDDLGGLVDMIVVNPPFGKVGHSRLGPDMSKSVAKHEISVTLFDIIEFSVKTLKVPGTLYLIYPAQRLTELLCSLRSANLEPKWLRAVHPRQNDCANRVIVKAVKGGKSGIIVDSPLVIYGSDGFYTPELEKMFRL